MTKLKTLKDLEMINKKIEECDIKAFKHCFKRGKMCDECWEKKQSLMNIKYKLIKELLKEAEK